MVTFGEGNYVEMPITRLIYAYLRVVLIEVDWNFMISMCIKPKFW